MMVYTLNGWVKMNETLVQLGNNLTLGQIYKPKSKENKLLAIQRDMDCTADKISKYYRSLEYLRTFANILLGKGVSGKQKHRTTVDVPKSETDNTRCEIMLEYTVPKFIPKDAILMINDSNRLTWKPLSRVGFFKLIREVKDEIKRLDREYGRLAKLYNEVKESKEDRKADLLELKELKLKEIALIEEELKNIG